MSISLCPKLIKTYYLISILPVLCKVRPDHCQKHKVKALFIVAANQHLQLLDIKDIPVVYLRYSTLNILLYVFLMHNFS